MGFRAFKQIYVISLAYIYGPFFVVPNLHGLNAKVWKDGRNSPGKQQFQALRRSIPVFLPDAGVDVVFVQDCLDMRIFKIQWFICVTLLRHRIHMRANFFRTTKSSDPRNFNALES